MDSTGWLGAEIEFVYVRGPRGAILPTMIRVGCHAVVGDFIAQGDALRRSAQYNRVIRKLRSLQARLDVLLQSGSVHHAQVHGSYRLLSRLDNLIATRQSENMGHGVVRPAVLDREIGILYGWYAYHESVIANAIANAEPQSGLS
jgi:predicted MPP superfamily phosphohydrolase